MITILPPKEHALATELAETIRTGYGLPEIFEDFSLITTGVPDPTHNYENAKAFVEKVLDSFDEKLPAEARPVIINAVTMQLLIPESTLRNYINDTKNENNAIDLKKTAEYFHVSPKTLFRRGQEIGLFS